MGYLRREWKSLRPSQGMHFLQNGTLDAAGIGRVIQVSVVLFSGLLWTDWTNTSAPSLFLGNRDDKKRARRNSEPFKTEHCNYRHSTVDCADDPVPPCCLHAHSPSMEQPLLPACCHLAPTESLSPNDPRA